MSNSLVPRPGAEAEPADGDSRFKSVQRKLKTLGDAVDTASGELEALQTRMHRRAAAASSVADAIATAHLDKKFVEMTHAVGSALSGAAMEVTSLREAAEDVVGLARDARRTHARLYEGLDDIRSSRKERTPKPGFFVH
ncbi:MULTISPECIES: conjugal transfer protein TraB [unclassified Streptomyces]|uniref:conjugal transfer protein TraB n=1 Tax=Streptomyces sp. NPDC059985 TaxID=3347025 RepID=UPI00368FD2CC